jgi:phytoene dehydrogenase-like protein
MNKSILIIGAGVSGLCAGIYGQLNGYETTIVEKHTIPGGLVTAFRRKGYLVDICIHWLTGSGPGIHLHRYWNEVGLLEGRKFIPLESYGAYHSRDGRVVNFYCDPGRLEQHLLALAPEDAPAIHELAEGIRLGIRFKTPEKLQYECGTLEWMRFILSMIPLAGGIQKWSKLTVGELAERFKSPLIRQALTTVWEPDFSVFYAILSTLGFMQKRQADYPLGGSLPLALTLAKRYKLLGGRMKYQAKVEQILVQDGCAVGVRLADGSQQRADVVISAADGYTTIFKLLKGEFADNETRDRYAHWKPFPSMIFASAGVRRTFPDIPLSVEGNAFELAQPVSIAREDRTWLPVRVHNHDPSFAPAGKTVLTSAIYTNHGFWEALQADPRAYEEEKERVAAAYLTALEQLWPGITAQVEMVNVATPLTFEKITGNWQGSITGWKLTPEQSSTSIPKTLPGLKNFWMIGHWVAAGGGLPVGVATAREVIWRQCKLDKRPFLPDPETAPGLNTPGLQQKPA